MNVKLCPTCGQVFSTTAAGLELMHAQLSQEHRLDAMREKEFGPMPKPSASPLQALLSST